MTDKNKLPEMLKDKAEPHGTKACLDIEKKTNGQDLAVIFPKALTKEENNQLWMSILPGHSLPAFLTQPLPACTAAQLKDPVKLVYRGEIDRGEILPLSPAPASAASASNPGKTKPEQKNR